MELPEILKYRGKPIRVVVNGGQPWWVLADICEILGIGNSTMVANRLENYEKSICKVDTPGGKQDLIVVNESGLYFVLLTSRKPEAKIFRRWVACEALPWLRVHREDDKL